MACGCINMMNGRLAEHNGQLVTTLFGTPKAVIGSEKIISKKRGQPPVAIASYCPFCGVKYDTAEDGQLPATPEDGQAVQTR